MVEIRAPIICRIPTSSQSETFLRGSPSAIISSDRGEDGNFEGHEDGANDLVTTPRSFDHCEWQCSSQDGSAATVFSFDAEGFIDSSSAVVMSSLDPSDSASFILENDSLPLVLPSLHENGDWTLQWYLGLIHSDAGDDLTCRTVLSQPDVSNESLWGHYQVSDDDCAAQLTIVPYMQASWATVMWTLAVLHR